MSDRLRLPSLRFELRARSPSQNTGEAPVSVPDFRLSQNVCEASSIRDIADTRAGLATECAVMGAHPSITRIPRVTLSQASFSVSAAELNIHAE